MIKQTSVQWFIEQIKEYDFSNIKDSENWVIKIPAWVLTEKKEQALQMERERIIHANMQGRLHNSNGESWKVEDAEYEANEWYVKTYGGQDE